MNDKVEEKYEMRKKTIIIVMLVMICIMAVGYAAFSTNLTINGTANIASTWKVVFTKIEEVSKTSGVTVTTAPTASGTSATFNVDLKSPGDKIEYKITVENQGTLDAIISNIDASETGSDAIKFEVSNIQIGDELKAKASTTFNVTISYNENITSQPNITVNTLTIAINYVQDVGQAIDPDNPVIVSTTLAGRILQDNVAYPDNVASPYVTSSTGINFAEEPSSTNGRGLYYTNTNTEDSKMTYYFRGAVENNYVKFADRSWRIIRINEDGSIRIILSDNIGSTNYNLSSDGCPTSDLCTGYMFGYKSPNRPTEDEKNAKIYDSTIKKVVDEWYGSISSNTYYNVYNYDSYIADAGFCNDRSVYSAGIYYGAYGRLEVNNTPQFKCPDEDNDLFTTSSSSKGNKALIYPVGLITADECIYAGKNSYLDELLDGYSVWTMTPRDAFTGSNVYYYSSYDGRGLYYFPTDYSRVTSGPSRVYPVINLKGNVQISSGNGTINTPYIIKTN